MSAFLRFAGVGDTYEELYQWSVLHPERFWPLMWKFAEVIADEPGHKDDPWDDVIIGLGRMAPPDPELGPKWFTGSRLSFAENLLRHRDEQEALVAWNENGRQRSLTYAGLYREVACVASAMRAHGIKTGDRVAGFIPNIPEALVAMLAASSIGAVWSSCSPDFGVQGVLDRFGQIEPRILFCADSYVYGGKRIDCLTRVAEVVANISAIEKIVVVGYGDSNPDISGLHGAVMWQDFTDESATEVKFERLPFDHPLYILYSSGTTGLPKCMVHGAGGTLLQHYKELLLHTDLGRSDRVFYFTTCGWMMWNWLASALAVGSTLILYDGSPFAPNHDSLWAMAAAEKLTVFGTSAKYLAMCEKRDMLPGTKHDLSALKTILSTGSPLAVNSFDFVYSRIKEDVLLASISGGTDIVSCFAGGNPIGPVYRGELQCRALAMA
ncbi:MAG: acetoacetate--CoA ligase, partial [Gemmatimonadaceae bacterium]